MGLIVLETIGKSREAGIIELQIPKNVSKGNHKTLLFMQEEISEEWEDFYQFFGNLNIEEKQEALHFIEFLYQKRIEKESSHPDLRTELVGRQADALEEMKLGELLDGNIVFEDLAKGLGN
jgi:hypothetical protein